MQGKCEQMIGVKKEAMAQAVEAVKIKKRGKKAVAKTPV
jgi:hypothetical protein